MAGIIIFHVKWVVLTFCAALLYNPTTFDKMGAEKRTG